MSDRRILLTISTVAWIIGAVTVTRETNFWVVVGIGCILFGENVHQSVQRDFPSHPRSDTHE